MFFQGEALQQMIACFCNAMQKRMNLMNKSQLQQTFYSQNNQIMTGIGNTGSNSSNTIAKVLCIMIKSSICLRLTPVGLSPMVSDTTLVFPYTMMSKVQVDYLHDILRWATFNAAPNTADPIKAIGYGNEVVVITTLNSQRIWGGSALDRPALAHTFCSSTSTAAGNKRRKGVIVSGKEAESFQKQQEASQLIQGRYTSFHLDETEVLKAFCACVFRSKVHKDNALREGICNVILQMVIGEVGTTRDVLNSVSEFIQAAKKVVVV